jgi:hypothetical protein
MAEHVRPVDDVAAGKTRCKPPAPAVPFDPPGTRHDRVAGRPPRHCPQEA